MNPEDILAVAEQSPRAVAAQDRAAWLALFSQLAVIEDPVGSKPHIGGLYDARSGLRSNGALQRFYDTFIDGNRIEFVRGLDFVDNNILVRDLALQLEVNGMQATVPMHLLYEMVEEKGALKVQRLSAHWEVLPVTLQMLRSRPAGLLGYGMKLLTGLGLSGVLGFTRALRTVGAGGKKRFLQFVDANNKGDSCDGLFDRDARGISCPCSDAWMTAAEFCALGLNLTPGKLIAAGNRVTCSLKIRRGDEDFNGVAIAEFNRNSGAIDNIRFIY